LKISGSWSRTLLSTRRPVCSHWLWVTKLKKSLFLGSIALRIWVCLRSDWHMLAVDIGVFYIVCGSRVSSVWGRISHSLSGSRLDKLHAGKTVVARTSESPSLDATFTKNRLCKALVTSLFHQSHKEFLYASSRFLNGAARSCFRT
jgi:hypothetical protein